MDPLLGQSIGQYKIESVIGKGGMATVYKAYQPSICRYVAIKVLAEQYAEDPQFVKRFEGEAKAVAGLEHPNILPVYDFGSQAGLLYMVMRLIEGSTLAERIYSDPPLTYSEIVPIISGVADALDYAHSHGIIHRDIKPSNVMIDQHKSVLLMDFGLAKSVEGTTQSRLTQTGTVVGTATYMSPEQAADEELDGRSDVYSLGVVLFEMLVGRPPFEGDTMVAIALKHINEPTPSLRAINPEIPESFERVVFKSMEKWADDRYQTATALSHDLQEVLHKMDTQTQVKALTRTAPIEQSERDKSESSGSLRQKYASGVTRSLTPQPAQNAAVEPIAAPIQIIKQPWFWGSIIAAVLTTIVVITALFFLWPRFNQQLPEDSLVLVIPDPNRDEVVDTLGLRNNRYPRSNHAVQPFEGGVMFWWENPAAMLDPIYVLSYEIGDDTGNDWSQYKNTWTPDEPLIPDRCLEAREPTGPVMGFGRLWCYNSAVQLQLGSPLEPEVSSNDAIVEIYEGGVVFSIPAEHMTYVLYNDGVWLRFPTP